jgi:hypothetical protein
LWSKVRLSPTSAVDLDHHQSRHLDREDAQMRAALMFRARGPDRVALLLQAAFPGCCRRAVHAHCVVRRSAGGADEPSNLVSLCAFHHLCGVHGGWLRVRGRAPDGLASEVGPPGAPVDLRLFCLTGGDVSAAAPWSTLPRSLPDGARAKPSGARFEG